MSKTRNIIHIGNRKNAFRVSCCWFAGLSIHRFLCIQNPTVYRRPSVVDAAHRFDKCFRYQFAPPRAPSRAPYTLYAHGTFPSSQLRRPPRNTVVQRDDSSTTCRQNKLNSPVGYGGQHPCEDDGGSVTAARQQDSTARAACSSITCDPLTIGNVRWESVTNQNSVLDIAAVRTPPCPSREAYRKQVNQLPETSVLMQVRLADWITVTSFVYTGGHANDDSSDGYLCYFGSSKVRKLLLMRCSCFTSTGRSAFRRRQLPYLLNRARCSHRLSLPR